MTQTQNENEKAELNRLIRSTAREIAYEVLDEHLEEYEHKPKKIDETELEG